MQARPHPAAVALEVLSRALHIVEPQDPINEAGVFFLALCRRRPDAALGTAEEKLHVFPFHEVSPASLRSYEEACLWKVNALLEETIASGEPDDADDEDNFEIPIKEGLLDNGLRNGGWRTEAVKWLDMALIVSGAPGRKDVIQRILGIIDDQDEGNSEASSLDGDADGSDGDRPDGSRKRQKLSHHAQEATEDQRRHSRSQVSEPENGVIGAGSTEERLPEKAPEANVPMIQYPVSESSLPSLLAFEKHVQNEARPLKLTGTIQHWPALHHWRSASYWLSKTHGGRRLAPVELGKDYLDSSFGQRILPFADFWYYFLINKDPDDLSDNESANGNHENNVKLVTESKENDEDGEEEPKVAYLAQHDLLGQIPALRKDIAVPDYCYCDTSVPTEGSDKAPKEPLLNIWLGPATTVSPAHTDPHHNILAQVFGRKFIRLFSPGESEKLYPMSSTETLTMLNGNDTLENDSTDELEDPAADESGVEKDDKKLSRDVVEPPAEVEKPEAASKAMDMSNTSRVDIGAFLTYPSPSPSASEVTNGESELLLATRWQNQQTQLWQYPLHSEAQYLECILEPGECLYIPKGWWHYIMALPESSKASAEVRPYKPGQMDTSQLQRGDLGENCCCSVSFWFD